MVAKAELQIDKETKGKNKQHGFHNGRNFARLTNTQCRRKIWISLFSEV